MPCLEMALEELVCNVHIDVLQEGIVAKMADDLYCGGTTVEELAHSWQRVFHALHTAGLCLSHLQDDIKQNMQLILLL